MNKWLLFGAFAAVLCAAMYILYRKGIAVTKNIRAVLFVFRPGRNADTVKLCACTGWARHVGRFQEGRTYRFTFDAQLTAGDAEVSLLDKNKRLLWKLNRQSPMCIRNLDGAGRYELRWEFRNAAGMCRLWWQ